MHPNSYLSKWEFVTFLFVIVLPLSAFMGVFIWSVI